MSTEAIDTLSGIFLREVERLQDKNLEHAIAFEKLKLQLETSNIHLFKFLDELESKFDVTKEFDSPQICRDYLDAAIYCKNYYGRDHHGRVQMAQEWFDNWTPS